MLLVKGNLFIKITNTQPAFTCSKLPNLPKTNNKDIRATPMASLWCRHCQP